MYKLHFGPGPGWSKPSTDWLSVDVDKDRADISMNFNTFNGFPLEDNSVSCIYGSHVFEHMSIFSAPKVFKECYRVLAPGGFFRIVLPDVRKSIEEYIKGNSDFPLFKRREASLKKLLGVQKVSLFELLKGDFLSPSGQQSLLGSESLAHQNAWDFDAIVTELERSGFNPSFIKKVNFRQTECSDFLFEGTYPSEANEANRSLYVELRKQFL